MFQDEDRLRDFERIALTQSRAQAFFEASLVVHKCVNCLQHFIPIESMGKRQCFLHSEEANGVDAASYTSLRSGKSDAQGYHPCCGLNDRESQKFRFIGKTVESVGGCCSADHVSHYDWRYLGDLRGNNSVLARVLDTDDMPVTQRSSYTALAARLHILPKRYVTMLFDMRERWYEARRRPSPVAPRLASTFTDEQKIIELMGKHCRIIDSQQALARSNPNTIIPSGSLQIEINLRDAYLGMCFDFSIPLETISNEDVTMSDASLTEESETRYAMLRQELNAPEGEVDDGSQLPVSMGGQGNNTIIDFDRPNAFIPFVVSSWIDSDIHTNKTIPW